MIGENKMLFIENVSFRYKKNIIFQNVNFKLLKGCIVGLVAPNGTGKSTLLNLLSGNLLPNSGIIQYNGLTYSRKDRQILKYMITQMPNESDLFETLSGMDHLLLYANLWGVNKEKICNVIDRLGMTQYIFQKVKNYSLGMRQRLCFAMVLVTEAEVMLFDEVMNGLDPTNVEVVNNILLDLRAKDKIIILASHLLDNLDKVADKVFFLKNKTIVNKIDLIENENIIEIELSDFSEEKYKLLTLFRGKEKEEKFIFSFKQSDDEKMKQFIVYVLNAVSFTNLYVGQRGAIHIYNDLYGD